MFRVINKRTGKEPDLWQIARRCKWAKHLVYCDMEGFAVEENGILILLDECGNVAYPPKGMFEIIWDAPVLDKQPTIDAVPVDIPTKQTNADRIRAMTDEELANFIGGIFTVERDVCGCYDPHTVITQEPRAEIRDFSDMIEWLKKKVTE